MAHRATMIKKNLLIGNAAKEAMQRYRPAIDESYRI
jgi:hypothetical protein